MNSLQSTNLRNKRIGKIGEDIAASFLTKKGYKIIARNYRARYGELDIVTTYRHTLIFIEVKTRIGNEYGSPEEAIGKHKIKELLFMADYFRMMHPETPAAMRIDAIAVTLHPDETLASLRHIENITQ